MGNHEPVESDPKALQDAQNMWVNFTVLTKYSVIATVALLAGMALFLL
ncbi:MAG: aa3-type cytochrome c oxidase subunit IV [Alphaproteobacteria bacterium]|nr:aa3-type cytochrome c oxidase subunit IV [Alphaproteobacteria bacterium]